jgi:hypothetical protein
MSSACSGSFLRASAILALPPTGSFRIPSVATSGKEPYMLITPTHLIPLKKLLFDRFTLIFGPENAGDLAVFGGFSAESTFHFLFMVEYQWVE